MSDYGAPPWFINGLLIFILGALVLLLVFIAMRLVGGHVKEVFGFLIIERDEYKKGEKSMGALNWRCVRVLFGFGVLLIVANEFKEVADLVVKYLDAERAETLHKSIDITNLFFVLALVIAVSLLSVYGKSRNRR